MTTSPEAPDGGAPRRPDWAFVSGHPAHWIAFCGGAGLAPVAPGTFGTLIGFPLDWAVRVVLPGGPARWMLWFVLFAVGVWAAGVAGRALGNEDHGGVVCDEAVAFLGVLLCAPSGWLWAAVAFAAFRLFDIWKPFPIRRVERAVPGGLGVMVDDVLAAVYASGVVWVLHATRGMW
jgi:phosphatidylglycerophosphatase A